MTDRLRLGRGAGDNKAIPALGAPFLAAIALLCVNTLLLGQMGTSTPLSAAERQKTGAENS